MRTIAAVAGEEDQEPSAPAEWPDVAALALGVLLVLSCTTVILASGGVASEEYQLRWVFLWSDLALLGAGALGWARARQVVRDRQGHWCALAGAAVGVSFLPALVANPSDRGVLAVLRWFAAMGVAALVPGLTKLGLRLVVSTAGLVTGVQVVVALLERSQEAPIGLGRLGEPSAYLIGGRYASTGLTVHPYVLAAWCCLAAAVLVAWVARTRRRGPGPVVAAAVPFAGVGLTMSRSGVLAAAAVLACLLVLAVRDRRLLGLFAASAAATALGFVLNLSGWAARAGDGQGGAAVSDVATGRGALLEQAGRLFADHALLGVGPGRYVLALSERAELVALSAQTPRPVHLTPFLLLVEGGLVMVPALLLLAWAVGRSAFRGGLTAAMVVLGAAPFLLLDHLYWSYPQGLLLAGLWLGSLDCFSRSRRVPGADPGDAPAGPRSAGPPPALDAR